MPVNRGNEARVYGHKSSHCISQLSLGNPDRPVFWGSRAPLFVFAVFLILTLAYRVVRGVPAHLALVYLYSTIVHSYGFEVTLANAIHMAVSLTLFLLMMNWWRRIRTAKPAVPSDSATLHSAGARG